MINNRMNEGVGKKIVEALKKQNDIEIIPISETHAEDEDFAQSASVDNSLEDEALDISFDEEADIVEEPVYEDTVEDAVQPQPAFQQSAQPAFNAAPKFEEPHPAMNFSQPQVTLNTSSVNSSLNSTKNFAKDLDDFEVPTNVAVLKQLISQLPTGVTKQTGAQIIRQTMEALGISMKSVLQEAQQVQESINTSARECQANIMEYKRQIVLLENQVQRYTRQSAALNDIISLFIQTGN